jgi:hypothetical protein
MAEIFHPSDVKQGDTCITRCGEMAEIESVGNIQGYADRAKFIRGSYFEPAVGPRVPQVKRMCIWMQDTGRIKGAEGDGPNDLVGFWKW